MQNPRFVLRSWGTQTSSGPAHADRATVGDMGVDRGRADVLLAQKLPDRSDVVAGVDQMRRKGTPEGETADMLDHPGLADGFLHGRVIAMFPENVRVLFPKAPRRPIRRPLCQARERCQADFDPSGVLGPCPPARWASPRLLVRLRPGALLGQRRRRANRPGRRGPPGWPSRQYGWGTRCRPECRQDGGVTPPASSPHANGSTSAPSPACATCPTASAPTPPNTSTNSCHTTGKPLRPAPTTSPPDPSNPKICASLQTCSPDAYDERGCTRRVSLG